MLAAAGASGAEREGEVVIHLRQGAKHDARELVGASLPPHAGLYQCSENLWPHRLHSKPPAGSTYEGQSQPATVHFPLPATGASR